MNPATDPPPPPSRASTSCTRHPEEAFTGFCPSCLCERLAVLDHSSAASAAAATSSRKPPASASAAALKALFKPSSGGNKKSSNGAYFPELRRTKSFSAARNEGLSSGAAVEPQRRSCDVRARNKPETAVFGSRGEIEEAETGIEIEIEPESHRIEDEAPQIELDLDLEVNSSEVREIVEEEEVKAMKEYIDELDSRSKKPSSSSSTIVGSFWTAASVLSKKLQKWRKNQKLKKGRNGVGSAKLPVEKPIGRQFRETQSEIADYGFGRRSCDTDPRFSLDDRRISFDDARYSLDEPRASWDGHLVGRSLTRMAPMLSVVEDAPPPPQDSRPDAQIPTEESPPMTGSAGEPVPGGSAQTRDYYDSSSRRRKSFERSASVKKTVVVAGDETKPSTAKVSPAAPIEYIHHGPKVRIPDSNCSEAFEMALRDHHHHHNAAAFAGNGVRQGSIKKSRRWGRGWSIWGLINRRGGGGGEEEDEDEEDRYSRVNGVVGRSLSESWRGGGGDQKVCRSNSSVSFRNSSSMLERNRSGRWDSPGNVESGMLRFYLTPLRGSRRHGSNRTGQAQSIARSVLRLY